MNCIAEFGVGLGESLEPALQGLVTIYVDRSQNAQLFTLIAVCETIADLVGGPLMAALLSIGRSSSHPSKGLCFLFTAVGFRVSPAVLFLNRTDYNARSSSLLPPLGLYPCEIDFMQDIYNSRWRSSRRDEVPLVVFVF